MPVRREFMRACRTARESRNRYVRTLISRNWVTWRADREDALIIRDNGKERR